LEDREDVLLDRQAAKNRRFLWEISDALAGAHVHRIVGDVVAVEDHAARVGRGQADGHVEGRRFAGAVRSEQADDLPRRNVEVHAADNGAAGVRLGEAFCAECRLVHPHFEAPLLCVRNCFRPSSTIVSVVLLNVSVFPIISPPHWSTIFTGAPSTSYRSVSAKYVIRVPVVVLPDSRSVTSS